MTLQEIHDHIMLNRFLSEMDKRHKNQERALHIAKNTAEYFMRQIYGEAWHRQQGEE